MKPKTLFLTLMAVMLAVSAAAQSRKQVRQYYYWINQAELAICDGNYEKANECYDRAFQYQKPLSKHLSIAYQLNTIYTTDSSRIYKYAVQKLLWGQKNIASNYSELNNYDTSIYNHLLCLEGMIMPCFDTVLNKKMAAILDNDQSYRHTGIGSPHEDSLDYDAMRSIFTLYGNYKTINDYTAGFNAIERYLYVPCLHYALGRKHEVQKLLRREVRRGNMLADLYMDIEDAYLWQTYYYASRIDSTINEPCGYGTDGYSIQICDYLFIFYPKDIHKVNQNRKRLGISETFDDYVKKMAWQFANGEIQFKKMSGFSFGNEEDDAAEAAKMKQEIDAEHAAGDFHRMYYEKGSKASE